MAITTNLVFCIATIHKSSIRSPRSSIQQIDAKIQLVAYWGIFLCAIKLWHAMYIGRQCISATPVCVAT